MGLHIHAAGVDVPLLVELLVLVAGMALVARHIRVPPTVIMLIVGLVLSEAGWGVAWSLQPTTILSLFLPPLLFKGAFGLDLRLLRQSLGAILFLAVPGVLVFVAVAALAIHIALALPWDAALLGATILAATDPISVPWLLRKAGAALHLITIVEGEGLLNDGTALVLFAALLLVRSGHVGALEQASMLTLSVLGGLAVGLTTGYAVSRLTALVDDHLVEMTLSTALAYGSYVVADGIGASGVLSTVCAGLVLGSYGRMIGMSQTTIRLLDRLWEYLAFFTSAVLFLLIGVTIPGHDLLHAPALIASGCAAVLLARGVVLYGLVPLVTRPRQRLSLRFRHVLFWGGVHGAVAVSATLSLPLTLPYRAEIQILAFGAIVFSLLVQGGTIGAVVHWLGLDHDASHDAAPPSWAEPTISAPAPSIKTAPDAYL